MSYTIINCGLSELSQEIKSKLTVEKELFFQKNSLLSEAVNLLAQKTFIYTQQENLHFITKHLNLLNSVRHINIIFYSSEISNIDKLTSNFNLFIDLAQKNIKQSLELVSWYLYYFQEENKSSILSPLLSTANLLKQIIKKTNRFLTDIIIKLIKEDPNFINSWYERKIPIEQWGINEIDRLYLQPKARLYDSKIDQYKEHLPYPRNQYVLENGQLASASIIDLTPLAKVPFKMIASQGPMKSTIEIFWSMVEESQSNCIAMLTDLLENEGHSSEKKK